MLNRRTFIASAAATAFLPRAAFAAPAGPRTFSYGAEKLDVYASPRDAGKPVLVYIHGGAWTFGDKRNVFALPELAERLGMILVSIEYRRLPKASIRRQREDVAEAINWVRANIGEIGGDPERLTVMGHSAGAHLGSLTVLDGSAGPVRGLLSIDTGAYDIYTLQHLNDGEFSPIYRRLFPDERDWDRLSPVSHIRRGSVPPVYVSWTKIPPHPQMSRMFISRLRAANAEVTAFDGSGYTHFSIVRTIGKRDNSTTESVTRFLLENA